MDLTIHQLQPGRLYRVTEVGEEADPLYLGCIVLAAHRCAGHAAVTIALAPERAADIEGWIGAVWGRKHEDEHDEDGFSIPPWREDETARFAPLDEPFTIFPVGGEPIETSRDATPEEVERARDLYTRGQEDDVEIDEGAQAIPAGSCTWVEAWVRLPSPVGAPLPH